jgi:hypothetical protein
MNDLPTVTFWIIDLSSWTMGCRNYGTRYIRLDDPAEEE